jgi:hypothetical protein
MARYFFHIRRNGETLVDQEGDEFSNIDEALASAEKSVRELSAARIKDDLGICDERMEIVDEEGAVLISISFHDVVQAQLKPRLL